MGRPVGVTILAILDFIGAVFCILGGIGMIAGGGLMASIMSQQQAQGAGAGAGFLAGLGALAAVVFLVLAAIYVLLGVGLWKLKNWARIITVVLTALGVISTLFGLIGLFAHFVAFAFVVNVIVLAIEALIIWYLLRADVKAAFVGGQSRAAAA